MKKPTEYDARLRVVSAALDKVEAPGDYCTMGVHATFPFPGLAVDGVGDVPLPLTDASAQALIAASHLAPFGHGEQTLVDTQVRNTWELSANQFRLENPAFSAFVKDQIAEACRVPLGIHASVEFEAKLYKLLLYEAGGKFDQHQDSEKENGMFGTLVVVLPGRFEGGELVVHHPSCASQSEDAVSGGKGSRDTSIFDASTMNPFALKYAAFYGDCPHEVRAVTKGYRLCLTYNLVKVASSTMADVADPQFGSNHVLYETLKTAMDQFFCEDGADKAKRQRLDGDGSEASVGFDVTNPETHRQCKLVYVLTHKYTDANLSFGNLKNRDAAVASSLAHYCGTSDGALGLYLCKINYLFSWHGDEGTMYRSDEGDSEDDEDDSSDDEGRGDITRSLELLRPLVQYDKDDAVSVDASGKLPPFVKGDLKAEVVPCGVFERKGFEFDGENSSEYTGNEGATSDRWYGSAALVVAPIRLGADWSLQCNPPDALLKQWFASVDSKPVHARLIAHAFGRFALNWSTTSALGLRILETAVKMDEIAATCAVLSAFKRFDFQPKMRELMASFDSDRRAKTVKFLVRRWRANSEYAEPNWFNLTASMLDGISDSDTVALVLGAVGTVPVVQLDENEDLSLSEKETTPEEFARVLEVFAFKSQEAVKALLESSRLRSVVLAGVPAIEMLLAATRDQPDKGAVVLACANQVLDLLTRNLWAIRNLSYKKRFGCPSFYDCACHALRPFLSSCDEATTFDKRNVDHLTRQLELADLLDRFSMEPSSDGAQSKVVLKKYESPLFKRAQAAIAKLQDLANEFVRVAVLHGSGVSRVE